ncbi:basic secretory protein-like protein [Flavivirga sp. 57AJ16]|uniref:basic secretory protein-like protein n=1 Tax=Flavivirga sp. 57AJ16 TaxID=3025307 RepID=UPI002367319C|nr:basic secretory protein-like protein [Flavivirga sp. 57AJ16]MDD7885125.1 basic secretory protein-like protein [Flavivirga sp. 57AJ16]
MKNTFLVLIASTVIIFGCEEKVKNTAPFKQGYKNIVTEQTIIKSEQPHFSETESLEKLFDADKNTKFLVNHPKNTITIENKNKTVLKKYEITSANDAPGRDPKDWTLSGSIDGTTWVVIDTQSNQEFKKRGVTNSYKLENNNQAYSFYKLNLKHAHTSVYGDDYLQIAEIKLVALTNEPISEFTSNMSRAKINDTIHFKDISANAPNSWLWIFENGTPGTSTLQNPKIIYSTPGNHSVTLITKNKFGVDTLLIKRKMKVYDPENPWEGFYYPEIALTPTDTISKGYKRAISVIPDFKKAINEVTLGVCKQLYRNISEVPDFEKVNFTFNWSDVLAARGGNASAMELWFSTKYIQNALKDEPDDAVKYELYGVLWHELTHGYQFSPFTADNQYKTGYDYFAFLEGEADLVRINAGYHKTRHPDLGSNGHKYLSGYTTTGFFLKWIVDTYDNDFIYKFNASVKTIKPWSYKAAMNQILDRDVDELWEEYTNYVAEYNKRNKPVKKKRIDWINI